jgi:ribosomal protein S18 acetylase RimI-like enzyme
MAVEVAFYEDPARVLNEAGEFLASEPVLHNLILTLLHTRVSHPEPGRYWVARDSGSVVGVVFQSPLDFPATMTPMTPSVIEPVVESISDSGVWLPGVNGAAATAARFAGQWTEQRKSAAVPVDGQRIYEVREVRRPIEVGGRARRAGAADRDLVVDWMRRFWADVGQPPGDPDAFADLRLAQGQIWLWEDGEPVCMAAESEPPVAGASRVQAVYTPPDCRNRGYAAVCVADLSDRILHSGHRCLLYTDLSNPTSNSVYRRIGYRSVAEILRYRFDPGAPTEDA